MDDWVHEAMDLVTLPPSRYEAGIAGNGSSEPSRSSSSSGDGISSGDTSSKPSKIDHPKPFSWRTRSSYAKRRRPQGQPPADGGHTSEPVPSCHRPEVCSALGALQRGGGATASKPPLFQFEGDATPEKGLQQTTNNVSSSDHSVGFHNREAPVPSPTVSAPQPADPPMQSFEVKYAPAASGGGCGDGSARKKSRLSLNSRRRPSPMSQHGISSSCSSSSSSSSSSSNNNRSSSSSSSSSSSVVGTGGSNLGLRSVHDSAAYGSPWRPSPQQRRQSPCLSSAAIPPPGGDRLAAREDSADPLAGGALGSMPPPCSLPPPPPPPPPFVGLENLGETCYVNAVVQALVACLEALMLDGMGASARVAREDSRGAPCSVPCVGGEGAFAEASAGRRGGGGEGGAPRGIDGHSNHVLETLGNLLEEAKERNQALSALASGDDGLPQLGAPQAFTAPSSSEDVATHSETFRAVALERESEKAAELETLPLCEPPPKAPDFPRNVGLCAKAINPIALVDLIRGGWLSAGRGSGGAKYVHEGHRGRLASRSASAGFGSGQQCASELLGKLLDLPAAVGGVPSRGETAVCGSRGRSVSDSTSGLIDAFRGVLSTRTVCVECERDRATREEFTELTLPPLLPQHPPPSPNRVAEMAGAAAANEHSLPERLTLEGLVDAVLGSETLDGNSKVWCEVCSQWTEAKLHFSIHSAPRLLALHIRPATGGQPIFSPPPAVGGTVEVRGGGLRKAGGRAAGGSEKGGGFIERFLVVKSAARSGFHETVGEGAAAFCQNRTNTTACTSGGAQEGVQGRRDGAFEKLGDPEDVRYELVGIILHKGQTLGSGHYTFALHTGATSCSVGESPPQRPQNCSSALGVVAGEEGIDPPPREAAGARSLESGSASASATDGVLGSVGEGAARTGVGCSTNKHAFALFDDACVRWLSPKEECDVFRGGGPEGGLGEAFLVFYARRP